MLTGLLPHSIWRAVKQLLLVWRSDCVCNRCSVNKVDLDGMSCSKHNTKTKDKLKLNIQELPRL